MDEDAIKLIQKWAPMLEGLGNDSQVLSCANILENSEKGCTPESKKYIVPLVRRLFSTTMHSFDSVVTVMSGEMLSPSIVDCSIEQITRTETSKFSISMEKKEVKFKQMLTEFIISVDDIGNDYLENEIFEFLCSEIADKMENLPQSTSRYMKKNRKIVGDEGDYNTKFDFMLKPEEVSRVKTSLALVLGSVSASPVIQNRIMLRYAIVDLDTV